MLNVTILVNSPHTDEQQKCGLFEPMGSLTLLLTLYSESPRPRDSLRQLAYALRARLLPSLHYHLRLISLQKATLAVRGSIRYLQFSPYRENFV